MKPFPKNIFLILNLIFLMLSCSELNKLGEGVLKGKITIGPLCPVETIPPQPQCLPTVETYKAWQTSVWSLSKTRIIADINPELNGNFSVSLPDGNYLIDFKSTQNHSFGGSSFPVNFSIQNSDTTTLNINIDTGIR